MGGRVSQRSYALLTASVIAGTTFWAGQYLDLPLALKLGWKGAGVSLLASYAAAEARGRDGWQIALVMALGALGDVLLELRFEAGAAAFLLGHCAAIELYLRHRREILSPSQRALAVALLLATPTIAWLLPVDRTAASGVAIYALVLGAMAATAWTSSFPRYRFGIGAIMFLASDLLIFARMGPLASSAIPGMMIWPLYYLGQVWICVGVVRTLRDRPA